MKFVPYILKFFTIEVEITAFWICPEPGFSLETLSSLNNAEESVKTYDTHFLLKRLFSVFAVFYFVLPPTLNYDIKISRKAGKLYSFLGPRTLSTVCSLPPLAMIG